VAIKAQGISPMAILWPVFILSTVLSIATIWLNDLAVSWGRQGAQKVVVEAVADIAYSMLKADGSYSSPSFSINVREVEGQRLISPTISVPTRGSQPATTITADWAELESDKVAGVLRIALWNSTFDIEGEVTMRYPGLYVQEVSLRDASRAKCDSMHPSTMSLRDMPEQKVVQRKLIEQTDYKLAARAAYQMLAGDFQALTEKKWHGQLHNREATWGRLHRLRTEPHRRCSAGFACLCFVWVGAPMAIRRRTSDFLTSFFLCFLPILAVYYPLLAYGIDGAKGGTLPPYAVWAGNILLLLWGTYLLKKVIRY